MRSLSGIRAAIAAAALVGAAATAPAAWRAGLAGGKVSGAFNVADYPDETAAYLCPHAATNNDTTANGVWYDCANTTWVYTGQIYLAGATTFAENIDDSVRLLVGGTQILNNSAWNTPTYGTFTPETPGWHSFDLRLGNGSGGAGPVAGNGWTATKGFGMASGTLTSTQGGDYVIPIDPGDRTLFRHDDGLGFDDTFTIVGVPADLGAPVPPYGVYQEVENGSNLTLSVASGSGYVAVSDTQRACCTGHVWYAVDVDTSTKTVVQSGGETSFAYSHSNMAEIVWLWKVENLVTVAANAGGTVSTNGGWGDHAADTLTITATPSEGYSFYQWTGEIDEAQRLNPTITVDFAVARSLTAAFGGIYYLSPDGDDANDGLSWPQAFLTLSNAVVQAGGGSTIRVTNGTYQVDSEITISKGLAVVGVADAAQTIIKQKPAGVPQGNGTHFGFNMLKLDHADASLEGLTLTGVVIDGDYNAHKGAVTITANGGVVRNCVFVNNRSVTYHTYGPAANVYGGLIDRCRFIGNTNSVGGVRGIVYLAGGTLQNCLFTGNQTACGVIFIETSTADTAIRNCTITVNYTPASVTLAPGLYLGCANSTYYAKVRIENTICHGNVASGGTFFGFPNWNISNTTFLDVATNSFYNCLTTGAPNGTCIDADPEFVDPAGGDFTLLAASPCIDAGYANGLAYDYDGAARPSGAGIDIGALEYDQSSLSAGFTADTLAAQAGTAFTLEATVRGTFDPGDLVYAWAITNTTTGAGTDGSGAGFTFSDPPAGFYTVVLTVTDNGQTPPAVATHAKEAYIVRSAAVMYVKPGNEAGEAFPYDTVANAAAKIPTAYAFAVDGTTIMLEPGIHEITVQLIVEKGVTFIGDGSGAVIKQVTNGERVIYMDHADARFENVAITGGRKGSSSALGGPIPYGRNQHGCGVRIGISGGTLYNCAVTNNSFTEYYVYGGGVGMLAGRVDRCLIADNTILTGSIPASGAGVHLEGSAVLENSVIVGNRTIGEGAVYVNSDNAVVRNCTIQGNQSSGSYSGGLYFIKGLVQNCAIYGNTSAAYNDVGPAAALTSANIRYCATVDGSGANAVACSDPFFTDPAGRDFSFAAGSDLLDAGLAYAGAATALDLAGHARVSGAAIDIGAYEYDTSVAACGIAVAPTTEYLEGGSVTLTAVVVGVADLSGVSYSWTLTDTYGVQTNAGVSPVTLNLAAGTYDVALSVSGGSLEAPLTELQPRLLHVVAPKIYGNPANAAGARYPWDTPATAATDLSLLVAEAIGGTEIHLAAGTFTTTNVLEVTRGMKVMGDAGRDATVVTTANTTHRLLWMSHADARVEGITFSGCRSALARYTSGGVIHITSLGGTLVDCRMTLCTNNITSQNGQLYAAAGLIDRCLFDRNKASNSSSAYYNNGIVVLGGTAKLRNSVIADNAGDLGGGLYFSGAATAENCTIIGNSATVQGGGVYTTQSGSRIKNCIIRDNASPKSGSATDNADLYTNQSAANQLLMFRNVCTPLAIGTACVTGDPLIKDAARGNYGIAPASPCRNAGATDTWMADARDYAGNARLVDKIVDIGACETLPGGTLFLIR